MSDTLKDPVPAQTSLVLPDQALPPNLFVLPVTSMVVYPTLMAPLLVKLPRFMATVEEAINRQRFIGLLLTRSDEVTEKTAPNDLYEFGVVAKILKRIKMPDGSVNILIQSLKRFRRLKTLSDHPHIVVETEYLEDQFEKNNELDALTRSVISHVKRLSEVNPFFTEEMRIAMINAPGPGSVADIVAFALALPKEEAQDILGTISVKDRFEKILLHLRREQDVADLQKKIQDDVNTKINTMQREFFLKEQLKVIKKELGFEEDGKEKSARTFREKIESAGMPEDVRKIAMQELERFETLSDSSPEYNVSRSYLEILCELPWAIETVDNLNLAHAREQLDADHYGLEKIKERIVEFLAVRKLTQGGKQKRGSIICLVGPPGVGKTSIGKSIAKTMGRKFYRFSLGGMRDEAEIKGHRRTYIGALPGKLIQAIRRAGTKNPVIMLDEIDKLGASFQGDPASALLEVLDPEQNSSFIDHYLDVPFDLSQVLFVATANTLSGIPGPLLDRMEVIQLSGYTLEEKEQIAKTYIVPKALQAHGLPRRSVIFDREALRKIMTAYSREPGMRGTRQLIDQIARKAATKWVSALEKRKTPAPIRIEAEALGEWLGAIRFHNEIAERIDHPGVVVGLAWTAMGGDILFIEAADLPGNSGLKLTGQMGGVMAESAAIAWSYVKRRYAQEKKLGLPFFKDKEVHLHIPAGAIPKDGPSAGVTMATALYSLFTGRKIRGKLAMTGELSLIGKVLPVGGIREKLLAAKRSGVQKVLLPDQNRKDVDELPAYVLKGLEVRFVKHVEEVFELALEPAPKPPRAKKPAKTKARVLRAKIMKPQPRARS